MPLPSAKALRPLWVVLAALVLHWMVLHGLPASLTALGLGEGEGPLTSDVVFSTRTIEPVQPVVQATPVNTPLIREEPAPLPAPKSSPIAEQNRPLAPADYAPAAPETIAPTAPVPTADTVIPLEAPKPALADIAESPAPVANPAPAPDVPPPPARLGAGTLHTFSFPAPVVLSFDVNGTVENYNYTGSAELRWEHDGKNYTSRLAVRKFGINLQSWTSKGELTADGVEPLRFGSKRGTGSEVAAHFVRDKNLIIFSANTPQVPLEVGAQDQLSVYMQLASLLAGENARWPAGKSIIFQAVGDRYAETWTFGIGAPETIKLPSGEMGAIRLTREANAERSQKVEIWYAPSKAYMPVQIRISQTNGDFLNLLWTESSKP
jgi:hypothetical protein